MQGADPAANEEGVGEDDLRGVYKVTRARKGSEDFVRGF